MFMLLSSPRLGAAAGKLSSERGATVCCRCGFFFVLCCLTPSKQMHYHSSTNSVERCKDIVVIDSSKTRCNLCNHDTHSPPAYPRLPPPFSSLLSLLHACVCSLGTIDINYYPTTADSCPLGHASYYKTLTTSTLPKRKTSIRGVDGEHLSRSTS